MASAYASGEKPAAARPRARSAKFPRSRHSFSHESPERLKELEKRFVLDGVALSHFANDETDRTQPSLDLGIPQYSAAKDHHAKGYFARRGLPKIVKEPALEGTTSTMQGAVLDKFFSGSEAKRYLTEREGVGAGYTRRYYGGHLTIPTLAPQDGFNGPEGYRRNTPDLRCQRSPFDYEDPFDNPKPVKHRHRTQSAPATIRLMRLKSASVYRTFPAGRRAVSAMPHPLPATVRELAAGPLT